MVIKNKNPYTDSPIMGVSMGCQLKAVAIVFTSITFLLFIFTGLQAERVEARANLTAYTSVPPNSWEPMWYNMTGTAPYFITHTLGWNNVKIMGNVGIGDGSVRFLNGTSNQNINYTDNILIAGDVSTAPWNPGRLTSTPLANALAAANATGTANATTAQTNATTPDNTTPTRGNASRTMLKLPGINKLDLDNNFPSAINNTSNETANNTLKNTNQIYPGNKLSNMPLNDPYHSILLGRPVDDLMYEYPLAPTISAYFKLVGVPMPCGGGAPASR